MARWSQGASEMEQLVARRHVERVVGARANGARWLDKARRRLATADAIVSDDPESAFVLAYDAARFASQRVPGSAISESLTAMRLGPGQVLRVAGRVLLCDEQEATGASGGSTTVSAGVGSMQSTIARISGRGERYCRHRLADRGGAA